MFYKVVIETGHRRGENYFQIVRYLKADNSVNLFDMLESEPGMASSEMGYAITMVKSISRQEYEAGREEEKKNPVNLRAHVRFKINKRCLLQIVEHDNEDNNFLEGHTLDISAGGLGLTFRGALLKAGTIVSVTIDELQVIKKKAEVVWSFSREKRNVAGLRWL